MKQSDVGKLGVGHAKMAQSAVGQAGSGKLEAGQPEAAVLP